jgi:NADH-quinone oxidoreductase subunit E
MAALDRSRGTRTFGANPRFGQRPRSLTEAGGHAPLARITVARRAGWVGPQILDQLALRGQENCMTASVLRYEHGSRVPGWDMPADLDKDPATIPGVGGSPSPEVPVPLREEIEQRMALYPDRRSAILPALEAAQRLHGWCSPEAIEQVACVMRLTPAELASVATFYDMLETTPVGRHSVYVCTNISCSLCGADELYAAIRDAVADEQEEFNVRPFECLGACDIAPMASVDGVYVGPLTLADVPQLLDDVRAGREVLPDKQLAKRPCADPGGAA